MDPSLTAVSPSFGSWWTIRRELAHLQCITILLLVVRTFTIIDLAVRYRFSLRGQEQKSGLLRQTT